MFDVVGLVKSNMARRKAYLAGAESDIRAANLSVLAAASVLATVLLALFFAITPLVVSGWAPSPYHIATAPVMAVLAVVIVLYRVRSRTKSLSTPLLFAFIVVTFTFCLAIDVLGNPDAPGSFIPPLIVAFPALFIMPISLLYGIALVETALFCAAVALVKSPFIAQYDIFQALVSLAFSLCIVYLVMNHHVTAYEMRRRYQRLSTRDSLADIFNKRAFFEEAALLIERGNPETSCSVVVIDIDDFKCINDEHGHLCGDKVLSIMGELLKESFRSTDVIGRFGGDEFAVFADGSIPAETLEKKLKALQSLFGKESENEIGNVATCNIGVVLAHGEQVELTDIIRQADEALYESKQRGKNRLTVRNHRAPGTPARIEARTESPRPRPSTRQASPVERQQARPR